MQKVKATYAKQNFGACIADAAKEPVLVEKSGRPVVVMLSYDEYARLTSLEDAIWVERAKAAAVEGYLSADDTQAFLRRRIAELNR